MKPNDELLAEAKQHVEMAVSMLAILLNRLAHCDDDKVKLRVEPSIDECFEDCNKCIYSEDIGNLCIAEMCTRHRHVARMLQTEGGGTS